MIKPRKKSCKWPNYNGWLVFSIAAGIKGSRQKNLMAGPLRPYPPPPPGGQWPPELDVTN